MRSDWAYRVTVSTDESDLAYEGKFVRYEYAMKVAERKLSEYKGKGAVANIYSRWDGSHTTMFALEA